MQVESRAIACAQIGRFPNFLRPNWFSVRNAGVLREHIQYLALKVGWQAAGWLAAAAAAGCCWLLAAWPPGGRWNGMPGRGPPGWCCAPAMPAWPAAGAGGAALPSPKHRPPACAVLPTRLAPDPPPRRAWLSRA
jgi:hypothetical protein